LILQANFGAKDQITMAQRAAPANLGGTKARTGGGSRQRSISTSTVAELGPCPSFEVPWSRVSTLAFPCAQSARSFE
jgi:hypothetical protein